MKFAIKDNRKNNEKIIFKLSKLLSRCCEREDLLKTVLKVKVYESSDWQVADFLFDVSQSCEFVFCISLLFESEKKSNHPYLKIAPVLYSPEQIH